MAYRDFVERLDVKGKMGQVVKVQIMTCIDPQPTFLGEFGSFNKRGHSIHGTLKEVRGIGTGVEFYTVRADIRRTRYEFGFCSDEKTGADARSTKGIQYGSQKARLRARVPSSIGSQNARRVGNQGHLIGGYFQNQIDEIRRRVAFNIEFLGHRRLQFADVVKGDMASVRSGVDRDAVCPPLLDLRGCPDGTRAVTSPRISEGGNLVDVDA